MLKFGMKYKIKNTNYHGVFIKKEKDFSIFLNVDEKDNILGVDFFNREIKVKELENYKNNLTGKKLYTSFEELETNKEIISIELCESGYWNILGYIVRVEEDFLFVQCIHENYCLRDGLAKIKINSISNLCYGYEREKKVSKLGYENSIEENTCLESIYEIYHKNPNVFILGVEKDFDDNFVKIKTMNVLGENDSLTFLKKTNY